MTAKTRAVVVGAGLAGLTAGYELAKDSRFDVLLLEARDRIGGRVLSRAIQGCDVDLGGFMIFPWYRTYRELCDELGLESELRRVPSLELYYDLGDRQLIQEGEFELHLSKLIAVATKSLASALSSGTLDQPSLDHYQRRAIEACIDDWVGEPVEAMKYKRLVDTLCQGYCYAPISQYKAAFAMPIYPRTVLLGGATKCDTFPHGGRTLPEALQKAFIDLGGRLQLGCEVTAFDGHRVETSEGHHDADVFVFAQNADHELMRDLVPRSKHVVGYTRFVTAIARLPDRYQSTIGDWGAIFFASDDERRSQVLSVIDLERLHATDALARHYTFNIRWNANEPVNVDTITDAVEQVCRGRGEMEVVAYEAWSQAMPISDELFVETVRALQGVGGCWFAGDYLGCPSMEVAVATGLDVARAIRKAM